MKALAGSTIYPSWGDQLFETLRAVAHFKGLDLMRKSSFHMVNVPEESPNREGKRGVKSSVHCQHPVGFSNQSARSCTTETICAGQVKVLLALHPSTGLV